MGQITKASLLNSMVTLFPSVMIKINEGNILTFDSWVCIAYWDGVPQWYLADKAQPESAAVLRATLWEDTPKRDSDMISGAYPTLRSTWVPVRRSTPIHGEEGSSTPRSATTPSHPSVRFPSELRVTSMIHEGLTTMIVTSTPRRIGLTPTQRPNRRPVNVHPHGRPTLSYHEIPRCHVTSDPRTVAPASTR